MNHFRKTPGQIRICPCTFIRFSARRTSLLSSVPECYVTHVAFGLWIIDTCSRYSHHRKRNLNQGLHPHRTELCRNPLRAGCFLVIWKSSIYIGYEKTNKTALILEGSLSEKARWPFCIMANAPLECSMCVLCVVHLLFIVSFHGVFGLSFWGICQSVMEVSATPSLGNPLPTFCRVTKRFREIKC